MKKIIAAFDGLKYATSTRDYAIALTKQTNAHLVGVFLEDPYYTGYKIYELIEQDGINQAKLKKLSEKDRVARQAAVEDFETRCKQAGIEFSVHRDHAIAKQELKHETVYADLLIISNRETLTHFTEPLPTPFIKDILADAQCPVLVVPEKYRPIEKLIFLYDGGPSAVHAIKMSSYTMPELKDLEKEVVAVNPVNGTKHLPSGKQMKEFMKRHFPKAVYTVLKGFSDVTITRHLKETKSHALVVLGAYRRGTVSRWFKESMADTLLKETKLSLFIAHNK